MILYGRKGAATAAPFFLQKKDHLINRQPRKVEGVVRDSRYLPDVPYHEEGFTIDMTHEHGTSKMGNFT
ncbi:hypothetical protein C7J99_11815 [Brevibacillus brevis]|nr:hypothetical protein C7J99_11815 [Brevibacillus brevis]GEC90375.1 hypothetical protein BBR01nite_27060 [Brevibacillus brevis]